MAVIEATICTPFKQAQEALAALRGKVTEACKQTQFPHLDEVERATDEMSGILIPLLYSRLVERISVGLGAVGVAFGFRYDAEPEDQDEMDMSALQLVSETPVECAIVVSVTDLNMAEFLGARDLERCATEHVKVTVEGPKAEPQKEGDDGSPS